MGYTTFYLNGILSRDVPFETDWFWLLIGEKDCIIVKLEAFDKKTGSATVIATEKEAEMPDVIGKTLFYLSPYWQAFHIWMVLDPNWGWKRTQFQSVDALAQDYVAPDVSILDGREVRKWVKLGRADEKGHTERYYPAPDQVTKPEALSRVVPDGWSHESCTLCHQHIDVGDFAYCGPDSRWMCESCYDKYAKSHDLSFVDEL